MNAVFPFRPTVIARYCTAVTTSVPSNRGWARVATRTLGVCLVYVFNPSASLPPIDLPVRLVPPIASAVQPFARRVLAKPFLVSVLLAQPARNASRNTVERASAATKQQTGAAVSRT
jgi:hypothetical protein